MWVFVDLHSQVGKHGEATVNPYGYTSSKGTKSITPPPSVLQLIELLSNLGSLKKEKS